MNTAIRAHRILSAMPNYSQVSSTDAWPSILTNGKLGLPIGSYQNPQPESDLIGIFENGIAWHDLDQLVIVQFSEIKRVEFSNEKESKELLLLLHDNKQELLPIRGTRGRFMDSTEVLRFIDRVMQDLKEKNVHQ